MASTTDHLPIAGPSAPTTPTPSQPSIVSHPLSTDIAEPITGIDAGSSGEPAANQDAISGGTTPPVPMCYLRVLIISGQYHVFTFEPETTVGRMKELIWSMWPSGWTSPAQPPSPSFLRILHAGRILADESTLSSNNIPSSLVPAMPTVIHLSVRSFSIRAEDDAKKDNLHSTRSGTNRANEVSGCKCVIM